MLSNAKTCYLTQETCQPMLTKSITLYYIQYTTSRAINILSSVEHITSSVITATQKWYSTRERAIKDPQGVTQCRINLLSSAENVISIFPLPKQKTWYPTRFLILCKNMLYKAKNFETCYQTRKTCYTSRKRDIQRKKYHRIWKIAGKKLVFIWTQRKKFSFHKEDYNNFWQKCRHLGR